MPILRKLSDMKDMFLNANGVQDDTLIYSYDNIIPSDTCEDLLHGITTLYPGNINGEYFMTKGHKHINNRAEVYYGLEGTCKVLCESENDTYVTTLTKGEVVYVKPGYAHRVINTSEEICKFFCVCTGDAGHDYNVTFKTRFLK